MDNSLYTLFVACAKGVEQLLWQELNELGIKGSRQVFGGIAIDQAALRDIYHINYCSRLAGRVLLTLATFPCRDREELYHHILKIRWLSYIPKNKTFAIDAHVQQTEAFRNTLFAAQVTKDAICDHFRAKIGKRPDVETYEPDVQIHLFIHRGQATLSLDTSGAPLYRRGYRQKSVPAPLQENLAAALLYLSGYQTIDRLCDPCCGSGTFLIEAALMASCTPPGYLRKKWGFTELPQHDPALWQQVKSQADQQRIGLQPDCFCGIDISYENLEACRINLAAAGFEGDVQLIRKDFHRATMTHQYSFIIANPPYGQRLQEEQNLQGLYRHLGMFMQKNSAPQAKGVIFTGNFDLIPHMGLPVMCTHSFYNGGMEARLLEYQLDQ